MNSARGMLIFFVCLLFVFCNLYLPLQADSLWNKDSSSPYSPEKAYKVGDIVNVYIVENTSAKHKAGTDTDIKDDMGLKFSHTISKLESYLDKDSSASLQNSNKYSGGGTTQRASNVTAKIAAVVTEVLENGNISIEGTHKLDINDESQDIIVSGIVRSRDITPGNVVYSHQIANAKVSIKGIGVIQEAEDPGWLTRVLNW